MIWAVLKGIGIILIFSLVIWLMLIGGMMENIDDLKRFLKKK